MGELRFKKKGLISGSGSRKGMERADVRTISGASTGLGGKRKPSPPIVWRGVSPG